jgi:membrane protease YdiL (CAAX protease family)
MTESMTERSTLGVLADVAWWLVLVMVLGAVGYRLVQVLMPQLRWGGLGLVAVERFRAADGVIVLVLAGMMAWGLSSMAEGGRPVDGVSASLQGAAETTVARGSVVELLSSILFMLLVCVGLVFYLRQIRELDLVALFGLRRLGAGRVLLVSGLGLLVLVPVVAAASWLWMGWLGQFWEDLKPQEAVELFAKSDDLLVKVLMGVAAVVVAPLVEETVFRGFVYGVVKRYSEPVFAALVSACLFMLAHFHLGSGLPLFVLAIGFTVAYELTGSLLVPMVMHAAFNALTLVLLLLGVEA